MFEIMTERLISTLVYTANTKLEIRFNEQAIAHIINTIKVGKGLTITLLTLSDEDPEIEDITMDLVDYMRIRTAMKKGDL